MTDNCIFAYNDKTLTATSITGGSWTAGLPLSNLKNSDITKVARSVDLNIASTKFFITLPASNSISVVILYAVNFSASAKVRIGTYNSANWNASVSLSGWIDVFPSSVIFNGYTKHFYYFPSGWASASIIGIEIDDTTNTSGYVDIGRAMICDVYQPPKNMSYGLFYSEEDETVVEKTRGGKRFYDVAKPVRTITMKFENMEDVDVFEFKALQRWIGRAGELFFILDKTESTNMRLQRSMLCNFAELNSAEYIITSLMSYSVGLLEIV